MLYKKTIYHEKSNKDHKGKNKWLHPDIIGVYFPYEDYNANTIDFIDTFRENNLKVFSFEMKVRLIMQIFVSITSKLFLTQVGLMKDI